MRTIHVITCMVALVSPTALAQPSFVDVTPTCGIAHTCEYGPTLTPMMDWVDISMQRNVGSGAAVGDYDNDGDLDVLMLASLTFPNRLFRNNLNSGSKSFTDVTTIAGVGDTGLSRVAHFADLDNDGWLDLIVINDDDGDVATPPSRIYRNNRDGTFTDVSAASGFRPIGYLHCGAAMADYDRDGLLDIFVTAWRRANAVTPTNEPYPGGNRLFRNMGDFQFEEVTSAAGLIGLSVDAFTPIFHDLNGDHWPDLFIAVDFFPDLLFLNTNGQFTDASGPTGTSHTGNDMGAACADFDDDGDLDIYTTNITDPSFPPLGWPTHGNCFYVNDATPAGMPQFSDEASTRSCFDTYWGWGTEFIDIDNDGDLDLMAANGFDEQVIMLRPNSLIYNTPTVLLTNNGSGQFTRTLAAGLEPGEDSRALIAFDYDRDGDQDILIGNLNQPSRLLENVTPASGRWLGVRLIQGPGRLRNAVGATVSARIDLVTKRREIMRGGSYLAGVAAEAHFGLGAATAVDELTVTWPDGASSVWTNIPADQWITLSRVEGDCQADGVIDGNDIHGFVKHLMNDAEAPPCLGFSDAGVSPSEQIIAFVNALTN